MKKILFLLLIVTNAQAQNNSSESTRVSIIEAAKEIIAQQKYCALATIDSSGHPDVRTMNPFPPEDDMTVWMATNNRSHKVWEIKNNPKICLYYGNHASATGYVTITGTAVLVNDSKEIQKRWREYWKQSFPDWQKTLVLIKIIPERLEVVNYERGKTGDSVTWSSPVVVFTKP